MASMQFAPHTAPAEADARSGTQESGAGFERWLIDKSFSLLVPMCGIGIAVTASLLVILGALPHLADNWTPRAEYLQLMIWRACALGHFCLFAAAARLGRSHEWRRAILVVFFVASTLLFTVYAFLSWMLHGDLSTYAIFLLTMVCVFAFPGWLRVALNLAATVSLLVAIELLDGRHRFFASGVAFNLAALALVSVLIDRFLMRLNRALYDEKCRVEHERERADQVLHNALPASIADQLKRDNTVKAERHPHMAVMFVDIVGFTAFASHRSPDAVVQVLNEVFSLFDTLVDAFGVEKIKTIGDAYMVVARDDAAPIAHLALHMQEVMGAYSRAKGYPLAIRCGIHAGPTVAGVIGHKRFLYDVWGDAVNTASRMESSGEAGRIQVSDAVRAELCGVFEFEARGAVEIKGKGIMHTWFLSGPIARTGHALSAQAVAQLKPSVAMTWADGS